MSDNKDYTQSFPSQPTTPAAEHAKRAARRVRRRRNSPSKGVRYAVAIIAILLAFFITFSLAYGISSGIIHLIRSASTEKKAVEEDALTKLQMSIYELEQENKELEKEIESLSERLERYNELYGPLEGTTSDETANAFGSEPENPVSTNPVEEL